jgi:hypothetical protein
VAVNVLWLSRGAAKERLNKLTNAFLLKIDVYARMHTRTHTRTRVFEGGDVCCVTAIFLKMIELILTGKARRIVSLDTSIENLIRIGWVRV